MSEAPTYRTWDERDCLMTYEWGGLATLPARLYPTRGKARAAFASERGCSFTEVKSLRLVRKVWDPYDAARTYREERCDDSDEPCEAFDVDRNPTGKPCTCPWPKDISDFWDESGYHCPWRDPLESDAPETVVEMWHAESE